MKTILHIFLFGMVIILAGCSTDPQENNDDYSPTDTQQDSIVTVDDNGATSINNDQLQSKLSEISEATLTEKEKEGLIYMREEEKLAHDIYSALFDKWGQKSFNNISSSEQTHTDAVQSLLSKYMITDPSSSTALGEFSNSALQDLYDELLIQGQTSLIEALKVGALVEEVDIVDLKKYISETDSKDIIVVYENLMRGSRNHLRAYVKNLSKQGITYTPKYLSSTEYDEIISTDTERGNSGGRGKR